MTSTRNGLTRRSVVAGAMALGLPRFIRGAAAQTVDIAAAKKEGKVVLYTSAPIAAAQKVANAFQQKYGITVELFRSGGTQVLRRFMMEQDADTPAPTCWSRPIRPPCSTSPPRACSCRSSPKASRRCRKRSAIPPAITWRSASA